jgi:hypothetical protein
MKHMLLKYGFSLVPKLNMVQAIDSIPRIFFPIAKVFFKGFYPNGTMKLDLVKVSDF